MQSAFIEHQIEIPQHLDETSLSRFKDVFWSKYVAEAERAYGHRAMPFVSVETFYAGQTNTESNRLLLIQRYMQDGAYQQFLENRDNTHALNAVNTSQRFVYRSVLKNGQDFEVFANSLCLQPVQQKIRRGVWLKGKDDGVNMEVFQVLEVDKSGPIWGSIPIDSILTSGKDQLFEGNQTSKLTIVIEVEKAQNDSVEDTRLDQAAKLIKIDKRTEK